MQSNETSDLLTICSRFSVLLEAFLGLKVAVISVHSSIENLHCEQSEYFKNVVCLSQIQHTCKQHAHEQRYAHRLIA